MEGFKEFEGKSLDMAIREACEYYNAVREKLEIEIIQDAKSGIFGLVGARKAKIRARRAALREAVASALGKTGRRAEAAESAAEGGEASRPARGERNRPPRRAEGEAAENRRQRAPRRTGARPAAAEAEARPAAPQAEEKTPLPAEPARPAAPQEKPEPVVTPPVPAARAAGDLSDPADDGDDTQADADAQDDAADQNTVTNDYMSLAVSHGQNSVDGATIPGWLMLLCSVVMALGTSVGGEKIIKSVGMDMVKLEKYQGFSADLSAALCLLYSSLSGIPVSTTHTKTSAIMGVGAAKRLSSVNFGVVKDMVLTWIFTFPGCGLISFIMAKLFIAIF